LGKSDDFTRAANSDENGSGFHLHGSHKTTLLSEADAIGHSALPGFSYAAQALFAVFRRSQV
jgi:hypothetical protein